VLGGPLIDAGFDGLILDLGVARGVPILQFDWPGTLRRASRGTPYQRWQQRCGCTAYQTDP